MKKGIALFTLGNMIAAGIGYADNGQWLPEMTV